METIHRFRVPLRSIVEDAKKQLKTPLGMEVNIKDISFDPVTREVVIDMNILPEKDKDAK